MIYITLGLVLKMSPQGSQIQANTIFVHRRIEGSDRMNKHDKLTDDSFVSFTSKERKYKYSVTVIIIIIIFF
jgi:hypothetical protein